LVAFDLSVQQTFEWKLGTTAPTDDQIKAMVLFNAQVKRDHKRWLKAKASKDAEHKAWLDSAFDRALAEEEAIDAQGPAAPWKETERNLIVLGIQWRHEDSLTRNGARP
jgi:hypothetical protein